MHERKKRRNKREQGEIYEEYHTGGEGEKEKEYEDDDGHKRKFACHQIQVVPYIP